MVPASTARRVWHSLSTASGGTVVASELHLIGSTVGTKCFHAMGQVDTTCTAPALLLPPTMRSAITTALDAVNPWLIQFLHAPSCGVRSRNRPLSARHSAVVCTTRPEFTPADRETSPRRYFADGLFYGVRGVGRGKQYSAETKTRFHVNSKQYVTRAQT
jgi:hypothetical protein